MMRSLLRKEARALLPAFLLVLLLQGFELLYGPVLERLDECSWSSAAGLGHDEALGRAIGFMTLALVVAYSLFPREHEEGTIDYLLSLPVSRRGVFFAKLAAGLGVLAAGVVLGHVSAFLLQLPNHQSFSGGQFRLELALPVAALDGLTCAVVLCHGVALSFFRRFGLVLYGIAAWIVIALKHIHTGLAVLDPTRLLDPEFEGTRLLIPWRACAVQAAGAAVALGLGYALWMGVAERVAHALAPWKERLLGRLAFFAGAVAIVVLTLALIVYASRDKISAQQDSVHYETFETARAETVHYRFTYPLNLRERALPLMARADSIHDAVRTEVGGREGAPIVADLTEQSAEHAGIASWQKIRMGLQHEDQAALAHVLAHETTHAFQFQESDRRVGDNARSTHFFMEGMADWVAFRVVPMPDRLDMSRCLAVAAVRRHKIRFDELADNAAFSKRHDPYLRYQVGEAWVEAVARAFGERAPGDLLRAMGRKDAPRGLDPLPFWQDTFQAAGLDLERALASFEGLLSELEAKDKDFLARLPHLGGGPARIDGDVVVFVVTSDRPWSGFACVTIRASAEDESDMTTYWGQFPSSGAAAASEAAKAPVRIEVRVPRARFASRAFEFEIGLTLWPGTLYEDWQGGEVPR